MGTVVILATAALLMSWGWPVLAQDSLPPFEDRTVVRLGDTVLKIAQRYGLTVQELLRLNPGLETASLVVGSQVRLAQSAQIPSQSPTPFDTLLDGLVLDGVVSPEERARIRSGSVMVPFNSDLMVWWPGRTIGDSGLTIKPLSTNELALLQRIRADSSSPQWRIYGQCKYNWAGWKLHSNGTRTTAADCDGSAMRWTVGVSCHRLLVATHTNTTGWSKWARPAGPGNKSRQGEDEMVAALCANAP